MTQTVLQRAVASEPFNDNQSAFARAIGTTQQNVSNWLKKGSDLPAEFVRKASAATGIAPHEWRPDIFPPPSDPALPADEEAAA